MSNETHVELPGSQRPLPPDATVLGMADPNHRIDPVTGWGSPIGTKLLAALMEIV